MSTTNYRWQRSILDEIVQEFPEKWVSVGPKHPAWKDRVKLEIEKIIRNPEEAALVDEKRRGLDPEHPFNKKLFELSLYQGA